MSNLPKVPKGGRYKPRGRFDVRFCKEMVSLSQQGVPTKVILARYKIPRHCLYRWRLKYVIPGEGEGLKQNFPEHKKRSIVRAVESGKMSIRDVIHTFKVTNGTITTWRKKYTEEYDELHLSNFHKMSKKQEIQKVDAADKDVAQLQQQLANAQLKIAALNTLIDVAEDQLKIDIRKKPGAKLSNK